MVPSGHQASPWSLSPPATKLCLAAIPTSHQAYPQPQSPLAIEHSLAAGWDRVHDKEQGHASLSTALATGLSRGWLARQVPDEAGGVPGVPRAHPKLAEPAQPPQGSLQVLAASLNGARCCHWVQGLGCRAGRGVPHGWAHLCSGHQAAGAGAAGGAFGAVLLQTRHPKVGQWGSCCGEL